MKAFKIKYTYDKEKFQEAIVYAKTPTTALIAFALQYGDNAEYCEVSEVNL